MKHVINSLERCSSSNANLKVGDTVYEFTGNTYGVINEDGRHWKTEVIAVTRQKDTLPFFTIALEDLTKA